MAIEICCLNQIENKLDVIIEKLDEILTLFKQSNNQSIKYKSNLNLNDLITDLKQNYSEQSDLNYNIQMNNSNLDYNIQMNNSNLNNIEFDQYDFNSNNNVEVKESFNKDEEFTEELNYRSQTDIISDLKKMALQNPKIEFENFKNCFKFKLNTPYFKEYKLSNKIKQNMDYVKDFSYVIGIVYYRLFNYFEFNNGITLLNKKEFQLQLFTKSRLMFPCMTFLDFIKNILNIEITSSNIYTFLKLLYSTPGFKSVYNQLNDSMYSRRRTFKHNIQLSEHEFIPINSIALSRLQNGGWIFYNSDFNNKLNLILTGVGVKYLFNQFMAIKYWEHFKVTPKLLEQNLTFNQYLNDTLYEISVEDINPYLTEFVKIDKIMLSNNISFYMNNR